MEASRRWIRLCWLNLEAVEALIAFKHALTRLLVQCDLPGANLYPLLLAHITREAVHFLEFLRGIAIASDPLVAILAEQSFWLRQMKEHIEFIIGLLDPSERELLAQAHATRWSSRTYWKPPGSGVNGSSSP